MTDVPDHFAVLAGDDLFSSPMLALGATGGIVASAHVATAEFVALAAAWRAGDVPAAQAIGRRLARLSAALFAEPNPTVLKGLLHAQGRIPTADVRFPARRFCRQRRRRRAITRPGHPDGDRGSRGLASVPRPFDSDGAGPAQTRCG